ncbi:MAG: terminase small subunit [Terriglobia bacterium]
MKTKTKPSSRKCSAKSKQSGARCKQPAIAGGTVCRWHGGAAPQVKRKAEERLEATKERVLLEYCRLAGVDIRRAFTAKGKLLAIPQIDEDTARAITGVHFKDGAIARIDFESKKGALDSIAKHLGMFKEKLELTGENGGPVRFTVERIAANATSKENENA